jgi:hypothetical protein
MLDQRDPLLKEMQELEVTLSMYKEAFPDNPAFATGKKNKNK